MPKITNERTNPTEEVLQEAVKENTPTIVVGTSPVYIASVNRLLNTGNYENVSIGGAISIPMPNASPDDLEALQQIVESAAQVGYSLVSQEVNARYERLKALREAQKREAF